MSTRLLILLLSFLSCGIPLAAGGAEGPGKSVLPASAAAISASRRREKGARRRDQILRTRRKKRRVCSKKVKIRKGTQITIIVKGNDQFSGDIVNSEIPQMPCFLLALSCPSGPIPGSQGRAKHGLTTTNVAGRKTMLAHVRIRMLSPWSIALLLSLMDVPLKS